MHPNLLCRMCLWHPPPPPRLTPHTCIQILDLVLILECSCDFVALMWYVRKARYPSTNVTHFSSFSFSTTQNTCR